MASKQFAKIIEGKICLNTTALTEILNVSRDTLSFWESQGCPKLSRGWWPLRDVLIWKGLIGTGGVDPENDGEKISWQQKKLEAEAKLKELKAQAEEFKNAREQGEYIHKEEVTAELQRFFVIFKRSVLGIPRRIATELGAYVDAVTARRMERAMTELIHDALEQLSIDGVYKAPKKKNMSMA